jgi:hypothetical protein
MWDLTESCILAAWKLRGFFYSHAPQQSGQQRCEESTPSHSSVSIQNGQRSEETVINQRTGSDQRHRGTFNAQGSHQLVYLCLTPSHYNQDGQDVSCLYFVLCFAQRLYLRMANVQRRLINQCTGSDQRHTGTFNAQG